MEKNINQENYSKGKSSTIVLIAIIILLILAIGLVIGLWIAGDTTKIINKNNENQVQVNHNDKEKEEIKTDNITNQVEEKNETHNNQENQLSNIIAFATGEDDYIYAITKNGNNIKLLNKKDYMSDSAHGDVKYTYANKKLYMYINSSTPGKYDVNTGAVTEEPKETHEFGYIDFNAKDGKYTYNKLAEVDMKHSPDTIAFANNYIYYSVMDSYDKNENISIYNIYKFNIASKKYEKASEFDIKQSNFGTRLRGVNESLIAYQDVSGIYIVDVKNGEKITVTINKDKYLEYAYGNKIIVQETKADEYLRYYEYDIDNKNEKQISEESSHPQSMIMYGIIPSNNYYIYIKDNEIYKYLNSKSEKICELGISISDIFYISEDKIGIVWLESPTEENKSIYNLKTNEVENNIDFIKLNSIIYLTD